MALSVLSSQSSYSDLQTFFDLSGPTNDLTSFDLMEYNNHSNLIQNSANIRSFNDGTHNIIHSNPNFHDYDNVISFVDSPPNSKESWPEEQPTSYHLKPVIIDIQTIYSQGINRKRRMDWDSLDINQSANNTATSQPTSSKVPNLNNGTNNNNNSVHKELDKKRLSGRGSWTDDIDFDLNGEFSNNVYLNNESFLSFSPTLSGLKQEIPSPQTEIAKGNQSPHSNTKSKTNKILNSPEITTNINKDHQQQSNPIQKSSNNEVSVGSPQPVLQTHAGATAAFNDGPTANGIKIDLVNGYQSIIPDKNLENNKSACNSPLQIIESSKTEHGADDYKFQYILAAATSTATKNNEEALTYLNQGQSYEIKLKKTGDLSFYRDKILKSVIKICFHERRLQYMEREQMQLWQSSRPGERIIEVDVPLSYGLCHVVQPLNSNFSNTVEVHWDPMKEIGVYIKVNCISTEFTPKKHGGEKGVPFRLQIETYIENANNINSNNNNNINNNNNNNNNNTNNNNNNNNTINGNGNGNGACGNGGIAGDAGGGLTNLSVNNIIGSKPIHAAACQIKVFKLKGADRKHKQDREKIQRRPLSEQDKYQPSYECTILNDISLESITLPPTTGCYSPEYLKIWPNSPVHIPKYDGVLPFVPAVTANSSPIAINSVTSTNTKAMDSNMLSPQQVDIDDGLVNISQDSSPSQVSQWLTYHRLNTYISTFVHFSGSDILRMSKEDLIQICGLADGIRMFNILHAKAILPRLTIYLTLDGTKYNAIYLYSNSVKELTQKMFKIPGFYEFCANISNMNGNADGGYSGWGMNSKYSGSGSNIYNDASKFGIFTTGPSGVHVMVTDEVLNNEIKDDGLYALNVQNGKVLIKSINKNE